MKGDPRRAGRLARWMAAGCLAAMPAAAAEANGGAPTAADIVRASERALAGPGGFGRIRNYVLEGRFDGLSGFPGSYRLTVEAPGRRRMDWDIRYISQTRAFDGAQGWERNATTRELAGDELLRLRRASLLSPVQAIPTAPGAARVRGDRAADGRATYVVEFTDAMGWPETVSFDAQTMLPVREVRIEPYEDGPHPLSIDYADYRKVSGLNLPFRIDEKGPDLSFAVRVDGYRVNQRLAPGAFANPNQARFSEPYRVTLSAIPTRVFKEPKNIWGDNWYWGMHYDPVEDWKLHLIVNEANGRFVEPVSLTERFYRGQTLVKTVALSGEGLRAIERFPASRFAPQPEIYNFRQEFSEPVSQKVDRVDFAFTGRSPAGAEVAAAYSIPVSRYQAKHRFIFPVRGDFIVVTGHEAEELHHSYEWSQFFAYDIVPLGPQLAFRNKDGSSYAFAHAEVIAPADGTVIYARNDVPDGRVKSDYLKMADGKWAIGGNIVLIDHGEGEYSLFAHMHQGSVRVRIGDRVRQGQVIGLVGMSGSPGNPHLHYQLQDNPGLFEGNGLPVSFTNVRPVGWYEGGPLETVKRGVFLHAQ